ncbi:MAG: hypothetical protein P4L00_06940 [Candidatus Acidoferrales bacterium]|nr:hypothetical protein [Candidatus Acidoferrales bacterium]
MADNTNTRQTAARAFVRSLNILLKFARMYDFGHPRTAKQYDTAWSELRTALGTDDEAGMLLAVSGDQLLLDGTPLESAQAEKSFARMLSAAGIASVHFSPKLTHNSLQKFVRAFPTGSSSKPAQLAEQLKEALHGDPHIHVNEVCFVPADSAVAKSTMAAQLAARTLGMNSEQTDQLLNDPEKLLQLIVAAEGTKGGGGGPGRGGPGGGGSGGSGGGGYGRTGYGDGGYGGGVQGSGGGTGSGGSSGSGNYAGGGSFAAGSGSGPTVEVPAGAVYGSGAPGGGGGNGWNIVGGTSGGGTPLDPNAGGFWLKGDAPSSGGPGPSLSGPASGVGTGAGGSETGVTSGWNIVGGTGGGGGTPLDPNAGGFWLKGEAGGSSAPAALSGPAASVGAGTGGTGSGYGPGHGPSGGAGNGPANGGGSGGRQLTALGPIAGPESRWANASSGIRATRSARGGTGSMAVETGLMTLHEDELQGILQVLAQIARTNDASKDKLDPGSFQSRLSTLPRRARFTVSQALSALAAQAPSESSDKPTLLKLAEHIAVRFALESYERGDLKVNAVRQMLDEMNGELDSLRKILGVYEEKMERAGIHTQSHMEVLAHEFWSQVPEEKKKSVLEGPDAWCVPAIRVREHVDGLIARQETEAAEKILKNYANGIKNKNAEARRQTAMGLVELAGVYAKSSEQLFVDTIRGIGLQLAEEKDSQLQSLMGAAFVRLSQEATKSRSYAAVQRSVELIDYLESERPGSGKSLRPRIGVENRLPEFIEESLRSGNVPSGLKDLLRRMPEPAADQVAKRFSRVAFREDCELLVSMMQVLGPEGIEHLRKRLREGSQSTAIDTVGILARMDLETVEKVLPDRMREWKRTAHDRVVRQIASSGSPERGRLLLQLFDLMDSLIRPLAVDEIGMSGEKSADMRLLRIAEGDLPKGSTDFLRLKAIEALGRLRTSGAESILRKVAEARKAWRWANPSELRVVAAQAMEKIDSEWARDFIPRSGLSVADFSIELLDSDPNSSAIRQRRYPRMRLEHSMSATTTNLKENCRLEIPEMALGGGVAVCEQSLHPGSVVDIRFNSGQKAVKAQTIVRDANTQARAFEVVDMDLEERAKLRKLLVQLGSAQKLTTAEERSRRGTRTIPTGGKENS